MPMPPITRARISVTGLNVNADHSAAAKKKAAPNMSSLRRPYRSDRKPEKPAPITPPIMMDEMTRPCSAGDRPYLSCRKSMAPEMLTVS